MQPANLRSRCRRRELRRSVVVQARLRSSCGWTDTCILNVSSRGLMIHSSRAGREGGMVELRRGHHSIVARVVWQDGSRAGLCAENRVPVEEMVTLRRGLAELTAGNPNLAERPQRKRMSADRRLRSHAIKVMTVSLFGIALALATGSMMGKVLARPLVQLHAAFVG